MRELRDYVSELVERIGSVERLGFVGLAGRFRGNPDQTPTKETQKAVEKKPDAEEHCKYLKVTMNLQTWNK
jgi:hypothetical protein